MTLLVPQQPSLPLRPGQADDLSRPLLMLFAGYPEPYAKTAKPEALDALNRARTEAFMLALSGLPEWAVSRSVADFIQGRVERRHRDKLPTAEQVAVEARRHLEEETRRQSMERRRAQEAQERARHEEFLRSRPPAEERARHVAEVMRRARLQSMPRE